MLFYGYGADLFTGKETKKMKSNEINLRDPFVLLYEDKYYMYGSRVGTQQGFDVYISDDLENWSEPKSVFEKNEDFWAEKDFWAPEVHEYNGKFYMFASFNAEEVRRGTGILVSDTPDGTFKPHADRITPPEWECLDGTFYVENGVPYMVFCHEWVQICDGEVCAVKLTPDLKKADGEPKLLWKATDAEWIVESCGKGNYITDGPFLFSEDGKLKCLWSSFAKTGYVLSTATSDNGSVNGNWTVDKELIFEKDGGHGMIFKTKDGKRKIAIHSPNSSFNERPKFLDM